MSSAIGVILVIGGCCGLGLAAFFRLEARVKLLSAFSMLAGRLACEIGFRLTPLEELPERLPLLKRFWDSMGYEPCGDEAFSEAWSRAVSALDLPDVDRSLLCEMGEVLGRYDAENQARTLDALRGQLDISLDVAREKRQKYGRLYALMGLLCGFLIVVVLI